MGIVRVRKFLLNCSIASVSTLQTSFTAYTIMTPKDEEKSKVSMRVVKTAKDPVCRQSDLPHQVFSTK